MGIGLARPLGSCGLAAVAGHGKVVLGKKKVALGPLVLVPRPWERPVNGNAISLNGNVIPLIGINRAFSGLENGI